MYVRGINKRLLKTSGANVQSSLIVDKVIVQVKVYNPSILTYLKTVLNRILRYFFSRGIKRFSWGGAHLLY